MLRPRPSGAPQKYKSPDRRVTACLLSIPLRGKPHGNPQGQLRPVLIVSESAKEKGLDS